MNAYPKRLIEVDLPIKRISAHARREKSIRHGHISTLHIWWARRPLAACRAVICAALWPDPAQEDCPPKFREDAAAIMARFWNPIGRTDLDFHDPMALRKALLDFIADFANWDNSTRQGVPGDSPRPDPGRPRGPGRRARHPPAGGGPVRRRRLDSAGGLARGGGRLRQRPQSRGRAAQQGGPGVHPQVRPERWPMKFANGASGSRTRRRRNWASSTRKTRMARRPSPTSGRGRSAARGRAAGRKCR